MLNSRTKIIALSPFIFAGLLCYSNDFVHLYDFRSYRVGPVASQEVFSVPQGIACTPSLEDKAFPKLPDTFEIDVEVSTIVDKSVQAHLTYDLKHGLVETRDTYILNSDTQNMDANKFNYRKSVLVDDYRHRVTYIVSEVTMSCQAFNMEGKDKDNQTHNDFFFGVYNAAVGNRKLYYKGQTILRRMLVDAWTYEHNGLIKEVYFLANKSQAVTNDTEWRKWEKFRVPIPIGLYVKNSTVMSSNEFLHLFSEYYRSTTELEKELTKVGFMHTNETFKLFGRVTKIGKALNSEYKVNFFHYNPIYTSNEHFSVASCYPEAEMLPLMIHVNMTSINYLYDNLKGFLNSLRQALADESDLSVVQISELGFLGGSYFARFRPSRYFYFKLLGAPPVSNVKQKAIGPAKEAITQAIKRGVQFQVQYKNYSKVFRVTNEVFDDFLNWKNTTEANYTYRQGVRAELYGRYYSPVEDHVTRYSPGAASGVAISMMILGASLCLMASFYLYKKRHPGQSLIAWGEAD